MAEKEIILKRSTADFWKAFEIQKTAIEVSSLAFDGGLKGEAARIATSVFLLFGRGMRTHKSIMDNLGIQDRIRFKTTVEENNQSGTPLIECSATVYKENHWVLELHNKGRSALMTGRDLNFDEWWNEIVLGHNKVGELSREKIIRILRDNNGGSHYDANITDPLVAAAIKEEITGFSYQTSDGKTQSVPDVLETTMRQIAEEVRSTIRYIRFSEDPTYAS